MSLDPSVLRVFGNEPSIEDCAKLVGLKCLNILTRKNFKEIANALAFVKSENGRDDQYEEKLELIAASHYLDSEEIVSFVNEYGINSAESDCETDIIAKLINKIGLPETSDAIKNLIEMHIHLTVGTFEAYRVQKNLNLDIFNDTVKLLNTKRDMENFLESFLINTDPNYQKIVRVHLKLVDSNSLFGTVHFEQRKKIVRVLDNEKHLKTDNVSQDLADTYFRLKHEDGSTELTIKKIRNKKFIDKLKKSIACIIHKRG